MGDEGWGGQWQEMKVEAETLENLRDLAGPAPSPGKKWVMVDLSTGEFKWYTAGRSRRSFRKRGG